MRLSDELVERIIELAINHLRKNSGKRVRIGDEEVDLGTLAEALSKMSRDAKRELAEEIVNAVLGQKEC
ncbi:MAG: hypothetical protein BA066_03115 [Candidatus Korarchaeota archaeon NZ13-K]|nr:MAG: hypothetical protein BA066_03115 [Candidatus Korarchaeota archaeon NZ13-K]